MKRISFRGSGENTISPYIDLMAGLLIVFIIISIVLWRENSILKSHTDNNKDVEATEEILEIMKELNNVQESIESDFIHYNSTFQRLEVNTELLFETNSFNIPKDSEAELINIGKQFLERIKKRRISEKVALMLIIDGRAARHLGYPTKEENEKADKERWAYAEELSYKRARSVYNLWERSGILTKGEINNLNMGVCVSGSGFGGQGRYPHTPGEEEKNRTINIQIIPYIK